MKPLTPYDFINFYRSGLSGKFALTEIIKSAGSVGTGTPNALQRTFGAILWNQINLSANTFACLPSVEWERSGLRVVTDYMATPDDLVPTDEFSIPSPHMPDLATLSLTPNRFILVSEISDIMSALASTRNDVGINEINLRLELGNQFVALINRHIHNKGSDEGVDLNGWRRLPFIVHNTGTIYGVDRSTNAWARAYVDQTTSSGRVLTRTLLLDAISAIKNQGVEPNVIITGADTYARIIDLFEDRALYGIIGEKAMKITVEGIQSAEGYEAGLRVASIWGIPVIVDAHTAKTGGVGASEEQISSIYILTTKNGSNVLFGKSFLIPPLYDESSYFLAQNRFATKMAFYTVGDLVCRRFNVQAKVGSLKK